MRRENFPTSSSCASGTHCDLHSFPTRRSSDLRRRRRAPARVPRPSSRLLRRPPPRLPMALLSRDRSAIGRSEEHTFELQSHSDLVCRLLLEKKKNQIAGFNHLEEIQVLDDNKA